MSKAKIVGNIEDPTGWPPQIIVNKVASPGDADRQALGGAGARAASESAVAYLTVQIAATLRFGARDKVTAQIVISVTSARDLRGTFGEVLAGKITWPDTPMATDSAIVRRRRCRRARTSHTMPMRCFRMAIPLPCFNKDQLSLTLRTLHIN